MTSFIPLSNLKSGVDVDRKFLGLRDACLIGLRVPPSLFIKGWTEADRDCENLADDVLAWFEKEHGSATQEAGLCVRFGDKFLTPALPPSICHLGSTNPLLQSEHATQIHHFASTLRDDAILSSSSSSRSRLAAALRSAARTSTENRQAIIQVAVDTFSRPGSAYGLAYTRNPRTGEDEDFGRYMLNVSGYGFNFLHVGSPQKKWLPELAADLPGAYQQLRCAMGAIEAYYEAPRFVEFGIQAGTLWMLQITRRRELFNSTTVRRSIPDEWMGPELPLALWVSADIPHQFEFVNSNASALRIHAAVPDACRLMLSLCRRMSAADSAKVGSWDVFLRPGPVPDLDHGAGQAVVIARTASMALLGRRYRKGAFEIVHVPLRKTVIALDRKDRRAAIVGTLSPLLLRHALTCMSTS